jgi:hypothetical protein
MIANLMARIASWWKQAICQHDDRVTTHCVGVRQVISQTVCQNCGKYVPPFCPSSERIKATELFQSHFGRDL